MVSVIQGKQPSVFEVGQQRIIHGDCLLQLRSMPDATFDLIVTSPPYNIGASYNLYDDRRQRTEYLDWIAAVAVELKRVLREDGSLFLNVGGTSADPWIPMDVAGVFRSIFHLQNQIIWVKSIAINENTVGHFRPLNSRRYLNNCHETVFHFTCSGRVMVDRVAIGVPFKDKTNIARWGHAQDRRCAGNVWFIPYQTVSSREAKFDHPAGFPVGLPKRCMKLHGQRNANILDPFLGTGTTLVAAEELGFQGTGIEVDPQYVDSAVRRLSRIRHLERRQELDQISDRDCELLGEARQNGASDGSGIEVP